MIRTRCPDCEKELKIPDELAGRTAKCPKCAHKFAVPLTASGGNGDDSDEPTREGRSSARDRSGIKSEEKRPAMPRRRSRDHDEDEGDSDDRPRTQAGRDDRDQDDDPPRRRRDDDDDDDDFVPRKKKAKRKKIGKGLGRLVTSAWGRLSTPLKIIAGLWMFSLALAFIHPIFYIAPVLCGCLVVLAGGLMFLAVALNESPLNLLMCLLVPFYNLFYLITRWDSAKGPFLLQLVGMAMCFSFMCAMPLHLLVYGVRGAALGNNQAALRQPPPPGIQPEFKRPDVVNQPPVRNPPVDLPPDKLPPQKKVPDQPVAAKVTGNPALDQTLADLADNNFFKSQKAADSLVKMAPNEHRAAVAQNLAALTKDNRRHVHRGALKALAVWATPAEVPMLIDSLADTDPFVRSGVIECLGKLRDDRAVTPLVRCFQDITTRGAAEKALRTMGPMAEKEVLPLLNTKDMLLRRTTVMLLKDIGTRQSVPALQALTNDFFLRQPSQEALAAIAARQKK